MCNTRNMNSTDIFTGFHPREGYAAYRAEMIRAFGPPRAHRGAADVGNAFPGAGDAYGGGDGMINVPIIITAVMER